MRSAVHFGAGNIGRGFIGLLLHQAGFHVTFVDVNGGVVDAINTRKRYSVQFAAEDQAAVLVEGIAAIHGSDVEAIARAIASADIVTTAVGAGVLRHVAPMIARGIQVRGKDRPLPVIACENLIGASDLLGQLVHQSLPPGAAVPAIFANCAVDRIVPLRAPDPADPLAVTVEPFCEWVIDASGFSAASLPKLPGALFVPSLPPYIERKLFTVNTGHAALAYLGYEAGCRFIHEAMAIPEVREVAGGALRESAAALIARHRLDSSEHAEYLEKTLGRFANPLLPDEVVRVGRSPLRKLGPAERLVGPATYALAAGVTPDHLARTIAAALRFDFADDPEATELQAGLTKEGVSAMLARHTGLPSHHALHRLVLADYAKPRLRLPSPRQFSGLPVSPGIALGRAMVLQPAPEIMANGSTGTPKEEDTLLTKALFQAAMDLRVLRNQTRERLGAAKAEIFDVHLSFLSDPELIGKARTLIAESGRSASAALAEASQAFIDILVQSGDDMLVSRSSDLRDVTRRLQILLNHGSRPAARPLDSDVIVVAQDLAPSDTAQLDLAHVRGFVTAAGSLNSHSSILARASRLPALASVIDALSAVPDGAPVILDGSAGTLIVHPSPAQTAEARQRQQRQLAHEAELARFAKIPGRTADGRSLAVAANIGRLEDLPAALSQGAEGIGLYRSEFSYLDRPALPTEDELFHAYRQAVEQLAPQPVIIRTLDIGGDKQVPGLDLPREENPFLGVRGLRLCLAHEGLFRIQLRALLRASHYGNLKIMFPMVAVVSEIRRARQCLAEERVRVEADGHKVGSALPIGIMIEVPAAALMADQLAREVDFFSIGTNDLVQYTMAADRMNSRLAHLQAAHHPAIIQLIKITVDAAHRHGKWVGLCGEMGSDALALPLLDGLKLDEISVHPGAVVRTRAALSCLDHTANVRLAEHCLTLGSAEEVAAALMSATRS